jgi:hypothetical protein
LLTTIKVIHTLVWAFFVGCIVAVPVTGLMRRFRWAFILSGLILLECGVLALNGGRCPLTDLAARYTNDRAANFDIYLPVLVAKYNKVIFGLLFVVGEAVLLGCWVRRRNAHIC